MNPWLLVTCLFVASAAWGQDTLKSDLAFARALAESGNKVGQTLLCVRYLDGDGVPQDFTEALKWCRLAAEQGYATAQFNLGMMYGNGAGVPQDYAEAVKWRRLAAEQGNARAQINLGLMYDHGQGVPQDYAQAHMWSNLAASRAKGDDVKKFAETRDAIAARMPAAQLAEAQRLAREWKPKTWEELKPE